MIKMDEIELETYINNRITYYKEKIRHCSDVIMEFQELLKQVSTLE